MSKPLSRKPPRLSTFASHCARCDKPIALGTPIERWLKPNGRETWTHIGCAGASTDDGQHAQSNGVKAKHQCCLCGKEGEHDPKTSPTFKNDGCLIRTCADGALVCLACDRAIKRERAFGGVAAGLKKLRKFWELELTKKDCAA